MTDTQESGGGTEGRPAVLPGGIIWPFVLLTSLFAWWGLANNMTDTLLAAFKRIMSMTDTKTSLIQVVFYAGGYGAMAIPAAIFVKKFSYKSGVLFGLGMYAVGALLFYPAMLSREFYFFLFALWVLSAGLSILETAANPYIVAMGPEETGTRRLNLAQSFNPIGSVVGIVVAQMFILSGLNKASAEERAALPEEQLLTMQDQELMGVTMTYVVVGFILLATWLLIAFSRMPNAQAEDRKLDLAGTFGRLIRNRHYLWGVFAQFFYVGAQIGVWSYTIRYAMKELSLEELANSGEEAASQSVGGVMSLIDSIGLGDLFGLAKEGGRTAEEMGGDYYLTGIVVFLLARFVCTWLMKYVTPGTLLAIMSVVGIGLCLSVIYVGGIVGVYSLVGISFCMSLMFPTIFGLAVRGLGEDTELGGAGVIAAILGGAVLTYIQGQVSDSTGSINLAYWVPLVAFAFIAYYGAVACRQDLSAEQAATQ